MSASGPLRKLRGESYPHSDLTERIIACAIAVHRELGPGYLEAIYENALCHDLTKNSIPFERQQVFDVMYDGVKVGQHRADLVVDGKVLLELKSVEALQGVHTAQVLSTLKAAGVKVGLLVNFNEVKLVNGLRRVVF